MALTLKQGQYSNVYDHNSGTDGGRRMDKVEGICSVLAVAVYLVHYRLTTGFLEEKHSAAWDHLRRDLEKWSVL